ncbi:MAG: L-cysteine:1D-myo-inositol 2-amino-2-deoxy-alpha-D-glucopyranoside ligase [Micromonosporaceae bacterium]
MASMDRDLSPLRLCGRVLPLVSPARLYVCGITPYDVTHLGHAATFIWSDLVVSVLRTAGVEVTTCRNVTDVDDVLTHAAGSHGRSYDQFALYQEYLFDKDMAALGVPRPGHEPRARHYVTQVQQLAAALLAGGHAYERDGHVYFRGTHVPGRAGLTREQALALSAEYGDNPDDALRDDPFDVPVWRRSTAADPAWPSPWGPGRPGWHAECAAMAMSVLGAGVDILAGGADLRFPHHAYQAAMAEAASAVTPFARAHLHVGTVHQDGKKMAKTTGNLTLVADLLRGHSPAAIRLLILDRPWHAPWDYEPGELSTAADTLEDLYAAAGRPTTATAATAAVAAALRDNLDVPQAVALARDAGGEAARFLMRVLSLT